MSLGTGLFLSSLVVSVVLLYGITKDRWAWRLFFKRLSLALLTLFFIFAVGLAVVIVWGHLPTHLDRQTKYAGVNLGMSQSEILYVKGPPKNVLAPEPLNSQWKGFQQVLETSKLENGKTINDYHAWHYQEYERYILVTFDEARQRVISIQCYSNDRLQRCPEIGGVSDGTPEQDVFRKLGTPSSSTISGATKTLYYDDIGVELSLTKEQVYMLAIRKAAKR